MESNKNNVVMETSVPAQATAGTTQDQAIDQCPVSGTVNDAVIVSEAAVASGANSRTFQLINKGQAGAGSTVIGSIVGTTTPLVAFDDVHFALTPANVKVAAGDVLAVNEIINGTGVAHSGYRVQVEVIR